MRVLFFLLPLVLFAEDWDTKFAEVCKRDAMCNRLKASDGNWFRPKPEIIALLKNVEVQEEIKNVSPKYGVDTTAVVGAIVAENSLNVRVKQVQSGVSPEEVTRPLGLSRSTVYSRLAQYREYGLQKLKAKKISGRPAKVDGKKMKWIYDTIVQKSPFQFEFEFEFALWTREMIQKIIADKFGIKLGLSSVSRLLKQ